MSDADDMAARSKRLARLILDGLDQPDSPEHEAYLAQKDRRDADELEKSYIATGQKLWVPAPVPQGPLVAAWDVSVDPAGLAMVAVGPGGATRTDYKKIANADRDATTAALRKRGIRVGAFYGGHDFVWVADEHGPSVWSKDGVKLEGNRDELVLPGGKVRVADIETIVSFVADHYVHRGVRAELNSGEEVTLVDEHDEIAQLYPLFGRNELLASDAYWVAHLGRDLAASLRVPYRDEAFHMTTDHAIVVALQDLADRIQSVSPAGEFGAIEVRFTTAGGTKAKLVFSPLPQDERIAEVVVPTKSGESTSSMCLIKGTNEEIVAGLRRGDTEGRVEIAIKQLVESQRLLDFR